MVDATPETLLDGETAVNVLKMDGETYIPLSHIRKKIPGWRRQGSLIKYAGAEPYTVLPHEAFGMHTIFAAMDKEASSQTRLDGDGILQVKYGENWEYSPNTAAQFALQLWGQNVDAGQGADLSDVINSSNWAPYGTGHTGAVSWAGDNLRFTSNNGPGGMECEAILPAVIPGSPYLLVWNFWVQPDTPFYRIILRCTTSEGEKYIVYHDSRGEPRVDGDYLYHPVRIDPRGEFKSVLRNVRSDITRLIPSATLISVDKLMVRGNISLRFFREASYAVYGKMLRQCDWLVDAIDERGGLPYGFRYDYFRPRFAALEPGWLSCIAQGCALSALSRAFYLTGVPKYRDACMELLGPFTVLSTQGGIAQTWRDGSVWYEQYPVQDGFSGVLNGFQFSLLGLRDAWIAAGSSHARHLYDRGVASMRKMLPLYDAGGRTLYDLSHAKGYPPHYSNWHYHAVQTALTWTFADLTQHNDLYAAAYRWEGYMAGENVAKD